MKLFICAGGTGGHIFPGIAVAEALMAENADHEVLFIGTTIGMEGRIVPRYGFKLLYIEARQFLGTSVLHKFSTLIGLLRGIQAAATILRRERPQAILGMGGFTSVPTVLAGVMLGIPSFIHEQNVQPGLANRLLSRFATATFISFEETKRYLKTAKVDHTGNPLRKMAKVSATKEPGSFTIFIFGGSRGAHSINESMLTMLPFLKEYRNMVIYHQTGTDDYERVKEGYEKNGVVHEVFPFTDEMERYYTLSDLVISRAGASTIFELAYFKRAAILIPYPYAAGGHQSKNAVSVERVGGGYVVADEEAKGEQLLGLIRGFAAAPGKLKEMGENMGKLYREDAARRIIKVIENGVMRG
jgi:UDP-N-acetylglucosamine--N-acetylmuramyl-(pentapeptide) pyrophosphoryl-undecaprenol N-acetylglucosamine transferase